MSFIPRFKFDGMVRRLPVYTAITIAKYELVKMSSGYLTNGAAGDDEVEYVAIEAVDNSAGASGAKFCDVIPIMDGQIWDATASTTPVQATHVGNDYDVKTKASVDLANSTDKVFHIDEIINATDKIVRGRFNKPAIA